jgi:hypothetical protein
MSTKTERRIATVLIVMVVGFAILAVATGLDL